MTPEGYNHADADYLLKIPQTGRLIQEEHGRHAAYAVDQLMHDLFRAGHFYY
jgi:hypothetical protein